MDKFMDQQAKIGMNGSMQLKTLEYVKRGTKCIENWNENQSELSNFGIRKPKVIHNLDKTKKPTVNCQTLELALFSAKIKAQTLGPWQNCGMVKN